MPLVSASTLDHSPPDWLVDGVLPQTGVAFLYGPSYTGKSLVLLELLLAVANGTDFLGHQARRGAAAYLLGEGLYDAGVRKHARLADAKARHDQAKAASHHRGGGNDETSLPPLLTDRFLFYQTEPFALVRERELDTAIAQLQLLQGDSGDQLKVVALDALSDFGDGLSTENSASANRMMLGAKRMARELGCLVLIVHHTGRDPSRMRGAQRLFDAADTVIAVRPNNAKHVNRPQTGGELVCDKSKYGPPFDPFGYEIEPVGWTDPDTGRLVQTAVVRPAGAQGSALHVPNLQDTKNIREQLADLPTLIRNPGAKNHKPRRTGLKIAGIAVLASLIFGAGQIHSHHPDAFGTALANAPAPTLNLPLPAPQPSATARTTRATARHHIRLGRDVYYAWRIERTFRRHHY